MELIDWIERSCVISERDQRRNKNSLRLPGGNSEREPPDPIPNSEVKTLCADGSVACKPCQSRSLPGSSCKKAPVREYWGLFLCAPRHGAPLEVTCWHSSGKRGLTAVLT